MKINGQLFEDVLSGKLTGRFVLRNGDTYFSIYLYRNHNRFKFTHPYIIGFGSYTPKGTFSIDNTTSSFDIIDFIPDTDMKENELTIEIPNGKEIDWQESAKQEKIVFKKKDTKHRSWEEYCINTKRNGKYFIGPTSGIVRSYCLDESFDIKCDRNLLPSEELAEAFLAMMQLMSLRQAWIGDWKPDWRNSENLKWCIVHIINKFDTYFYGNSSRALSFPTQEMATDFMNCFKDLLEVAKPLI